MPDLLQFSCSVDDCGIIQVLVDFGQFGEIDDGSPSDLVPHRGGDKDETEPIAVDKEKNAFPAEAGNDLVYQTVTTEQDEEYTINDNPRKEMRDVDDGLDCALEPSVGNLVDQYGKEHRHRRNEHKLQQVDDQGVLDDLPDGGV